MVSGVRSIVKFRKVPIALTLGIVACAAFSLAAQKKAAQTSGPVVFAQDKGKLTIKLGGQTVGHEEFEIAPSGGGWLAKGTAEIKPPKGPAPSNRTSHSIPRSSPFWTTISIISTLSSRASMTGPSAACKLFR